MMDATQEKGSVVATAEPEELQHPTIALDGRACKWPKWGIEDLAKSGLTPEGVERLGWHPVRPEGMAGLLGFTPSGEVDGYAIPFFDPVTGQALLCTNRKRPFVRVRLARPVALKPDEPDKTAKYLSPAKGGVQPFILPAVAAHLAENPEAPVLVTEGEKKCVRALARGLYVVGLTGIYCWKAAKGSGELHPALAPFLAGRRVVMIYDSDAREKGKRLAFNRCAEQFASAVEDHGAMLQRVDLPAGDANSKTGLDDFLQAGKTAHDLHALVASTARPVLPTRPAVRLPGGGVWKCCKLCGNWYQPWKRAARFLHGLASWSA